MDNDGTPLARFDKECEGHNQATQGQSFLGEPSWGRDRVAPPRPHVLASQNTKMIELGMKTPLFENKNVTTGDCITQFAFPAPAARRVSLAGDFNSWDTKAGLMHKGRDGVWHLAVPLKPGRYEYRFFADDVWCNDPAAQQMTRNSLGTENCVRIV